MKTCSKCGATKSLEDYRRRATSVGVHGVCRDCQNAWQRERYAKVVAKPDDFDEQPTNPGAPAFDDIAVGENVPDGHRLKGLSTLVDGAGNIKARWVKTTAQDWTHEHIIESVRQLSADVPRAEPIRPPDHADDDLLAVYPIGDAHFGMLAWGQECGEPFDLEIAERNLISAVDHLTMLAPPSKSALIINIGDFVHTDGLSNTTTKGTRVDVDGRWPKIIQTAVRALRCNIDLALAKHEHVTLWNLRGNHDDLSAMVLSIALGQFYEREPRVTVNQSPEMAYWYRFGANLIGANHGEKMRALETLGSMVVDRAKDVGETKHRRIYQGHVHHEAVKELPGVTVESLNTLAGLDAWHKGQGYRATRSMQLDVFHREWGLINRHRVGIEQIRRVS